MTQKKRENINFNISNNEIVIDEISIPFIKRVVLLLFFWRKIRFILKGPVTINGEELTK